MLLYHLEAVSSQKWLIRIEEKGSRRILYLDTLNRLAKEEDKPVLSFLTKVHLRSPNVSRLIETISFQRIELSHEQSLEALTLLSKTNRLHCKNICLQGAWNQIAQIYWKEEGGLFSPFIQWNMQNIPFSECTHIAPAWAVFRGSIFPLKTSVSWKWVELFLQGPLVLQGAQKKKFLDEEPSVIWKEKTVEKPVEALPELVLTDATCCFANLWMNYPGQKRILFEEISSLDCPVEKGWEKDLLESGFCRKIVGGSRYYCPGDKALETLHFLLDLGWKIFSHQGKRILRQTKIAWDVREEKGNIAIQAKVYFGSQESSLALAMKAPSIWLSLNENSVGLLDRKKWASLEGEWIGDLFQVKKSSLKNLPSLFIGDAVHWESRISKMIEGLQEGACFEASPPGSSFLGKLLPYQQKGVDWLSFLQKWGFSGLLGDEMGLGKTVQVLAFFSQLKTNLPILIVAPSSLLYQWKQEILRFLPSFSVCIHSGSSRLDDFSADIVITSYAVLRLDLEILSKIQFEVVVLDESNAIKTSTTLTAQAAYKLRGHFKIALTGTPIENRFEELLSQMKFLMPDFHATQIESLKTQIRPFVLRRKKEDVLLDLPEKMEQITWVELNEEQEALYQSFLSQARGKLLKKIEEDGIAKHRMEALELILRLRQICLDPRLVGGRSQGSKLDLLLDEIEDRKVLVYSQFTSMLQLVGKALEERGKRFLYLDGSISSEKRASLVREFQEDPETPSIFLLSLKAGGVGLNLTAADYVFLLDPWWNEAVENQAIDRAHRLGQKKTVIAKRYLVPNSIEEKMLRLKEKKRGVAELLLEREEFSWTEEDLLHLLT